MGEKEELSTRTCSSFPGREKEGLSITRDKDVGCDGEKLFIFSRYKDFCSCFAVMFLITDRVITFICDWVLVGFPALLTEKEERPVNIHSSFGFL